MTELNESLGKICRIDTGYQATLNRAIDHPQAAVWAMLTEPARIKDWLAPGEIELWKGGAAKLNFVDSGIVIDSTVTEFDPPALLEYSWSGPGEALRPIRWQTKATDTGCLLTLTISSPEDDDMARNCAGWEAHLMMLMAALEGVPIKFPFERFQNTRNEYNTLMDQL